LFGDGLEFGQCAGLRLLTAIALPGTRYGFASKFFEFAFALQDFAAAGL
jgi:hypothetical protein